MAIEIIEKEMALLTMRLTLAMTEQGVSVYELAKRARLPLYSVQKLCKGECERTSIWTLKAAASALGVSVDYLLGLKEGGSDV